jgi:enoyl-CoA hydratase
VADLCPPHRPVTVLLEREEPVAVVRLNRPEALNALSNQLMSELVGALENLDDDEAVRCIVIAGDEKAFASGADIGELSDPTPLELYFGGRIDKWDAIRSVRIPIVAAVSGYCLGGGCELAMACDLIVASETAQFGQPETNLGVMPGAGGTQRLTRAIGKSKAMDVILTGRFLTAREAEAAGLVARVVAAEAWLDEAKRVAQAIAAKSPVGVRLAKEAVNQAFETNLRAGLDAERKAFHLALSSEDAQEGMKAFLEKRRPEIKGK